jgi:hypothetical protein
VSGLDWRTTRDAMSLMLCQATMPGEIMHSPQTVIRAVREAFPAQAAVIAAQLAKGGVAGFEAPFEGKAGFFQLYADGLFDRGVLLDGLGRKYFGEELSFKPWPACRGTHAFIELARVLAICFPGDVLVITRIDRLARSMLDLQTIVHDLRKRGVALRATEQHIDTGTASGKAFLDMLGVFAEFETNLRRERQMEGIAKAKAAGKYTGRRPSVDRGRVRALLAAGKGPTAIARELGCDPSTVHRLIHCGEVV